MEKIKEWRHLSSDMKIIKLGYYNNTYYKVSEEKYYSDPRNWSIINGTFKLKYVINSTMYRK